jgi:hypothetical protein
MTFCNQSNCQNELEKINTDPIMIHLLHFGENGFLLVIYFLTYEGRARYGSITSVMHESILLNLSNDMPYFDRCHFKEC